MANGIVCVTPGKLPANMIVAPNSPRARAQVMTAPAPKLGKAIGRVTVRKTFAGDAPRSAATSSRSRSTRLNPALLARTKNGAATKICASTTAVVVKPTAIPTLFTNAPQHHCGQRP